MAPRTERARTRLVIAAMAAMGMAGIGAAGPLIAAASPATAAQADATAAIAPELATEGDAGGAPAEPRAATPEQEASRPDAAARPSGGGGKHAAAIDRPPPAPEGADGTQAPAGADAAPDASTGQTQATQAPPPPGDAGLHTPDGAAEPEDTAQGRALPEPAAQVTPPAAPDTPPPAPHAPRAGPGASVRAQDALPDPRAAPRGRSGDAPEPAPSADIAEAPAASADVPAAGAAQRPGIPAAAVGVVPAIPPVPAALRTPGPFVPIEVPASDGGVPAGAATAAAPLPPGLPPPQDTPQAPEPAAAEGPDPEPPDAVEAGTAAPPPASPAKPAEGVPRRLPSQDGADPGTEPAQSKPPQVPTSATAAAAPASASPRPPARTDPPTTDGAVPGGPDPAAAESRPGAAAADPTRPDDAQAGPATTAGTPSQTPGAPQAHAVSPPAWPDTRPALVRAATEGRFGRAHLPTACTATTQAQLDTALVLLHAGHVDAARTLLDQAGTADAGCTGVSIGQALAAWAQGGRSHVAAGQAALAQARALGAHNGAESAWIEALGAYFDGEGRSDAVRRGALRERLRRWHDEQPLDDDLAVLYAASLLDPQPPGGAPVRAQAVADAVVQRTPGHAGAARIVLRAARARGDALAALNAAQAWARAAPGSARAALAVAQQAAALGLYEPAAQAAASAGQLARQVDEAAIAARAARVHADAALQRCDAAGARAALKVLDGLGPYGAAPATWVRAGMALHAQDWSAAADLEVPSQPPLAAAWAHAARAIGRAQLGETPEPDLPDDLGDRSDARTGAAISAVRLVVRASAAVQAGEGERAMELYDAAAAFEARAGAALVPPLPVAVLKGSLLLTLSRPAEALAAFERALAHPPNGRAALAGAQAAAQALGDTARAQAYQARLAPACGRADPEPADRGKPRP